MSVVEQLRELAALIQSKMHPVPIRAGACWMLWKRESCRSCWQSNFEPSDLPNLTSAHQTQNIHKTNASMPPEVFEPATGGRPQKHSLDHAGSGNVTNDLRPIIMEGFKMPNILP